jgi:hypothetical protein
MIWSLRSLIVTALLAASNGYCQQAPAATAVQPLPRNTLYRLLFREIAAFQNQAAQLAAQGKSNTFVSTYHQNQFHLDASQAAELIQIALSCAQQIQALDDQARLIVQQVKKQYGMSPNVAVPPPPPALAELEALRTSIVLAAADSIASAFGPVEFASFEPLVQKHFGSRHSAPAAISTN